MRTELPPKISFIIPGLMNGYNNDHDLSQVSDHAPLNTSFQVGLEKLRANDN
jgi:hypothetical protein